MAESKKHSHTLLHLVILVLVLIALGIFVKHLARQGKWTSYVVDSQKKMAAVKALDSANDGAVYAATITTLPDGNPLFENPTALQDYVSMLADTTGREIIIVDPAKKIMADVIPANVGSKFNMDKAGEVTATIGDGNPRDFKAATVDNPGGSTFTVVPVKDGNGATIGAIILSTSPVFEK